MGELELLACIAKGMTRDKAYRFVRYGEHQPFIKNSNESRRSRKIVSYYFELRPEHIVHHEDRNERNNDPRNLKVFASNNEHMRYHRGYSAKPLWDGAKADLFKIGHKV